MAANIGKLSRASIAKESTWGTAATTTLPISVTSIGVANKVDTVKDPRFVGDIYTNDLVKVGESPAGNVPVTLHPAEVGPLMHWSLMKVDTKTTSCEAYLIVYYVGTDAYADLEIASDVWIGSSGATVGTKAGKFSFDGANASYDTVAKMAAAITAVAGSNWKAFAFGYQSSATVNVADQVATAFTLTPTVNAQVLQSLSASTTTKLHKVRPAGATDSEPAYTLCTDITLGTNKAMSFSGCKVGSMAMKFAPKALITADIAITAKKRTTGVTYPSITIPTDPAYATGSTQVLINGALSSVVRDMTLTINNGLSSDHMVGDQYIYEQTRGDATVTLAGTLNLVIADYDIIDPNFYSLAAGFETFIYCQNAEWADSANHVYYNFLIRIPSLKLSDYTPKPTGAGRITVSFSGEGVKSAVDDHVTIWVTDKNTGDY